MIRNERRRARRTRGTAQTEVTVAQVKARFAEQMRRAESGEPVVITRHGTPVVAMVPVEDLMALRRLRAAGPQGGLASVAGGWEGSEVLARRIHDPVRATARPSPHPGSGTPIDPSAPH
jgi:prevent-host-death family protein